MDLLTRLTSIISGGVSEDEVYAEYPFTRESNTALGRKPRHVLQGAHWESIGTIRDLQELSVYQYGGLVPEEAAKEVALYIITEGLLD